MTERVTPQRAAVDGPTRLLPAVGTLPHQDVTRSEVDGSGSDRLRRPGMWCFVVTFLLILPATFLWYDPKTTALGWVVTIVWSLPLGSALIGLYGALRTRSRLRMWQQPVTPVGDEMLVVVVPTIGRDDTYPALERSVRSFCDYLPEHFPRLRVDVLIEEGCEAQLRILRMIGHKPLARAVVVPAEYRTPYGSRFKARANHYAHEQRLRDGEARDDVWVLHMDDDTAVGADTSREIARFIHAQSGAERPKHLAQGVLTYPRDDSVNRWTWLADAIRPSDDVGRFAAFTGGGRPLSGVHGELLLLRGSIEGHIGWDFGPNAIVEDAEFAMRFAVAHPGRSGWFPGRCYGASPVTVRDLVKQRRRWSAGLIALALRGNIPLRARMLLAYYMSTWILGPLQHVAVVLAIAALTGDFTTSPATPWVLGLWAINMAYVVWMYWWGLDINTRAGGQRRPTVAQRALVLLMLPVSSLWEGMGGFLGFADFLRGRADKFVVIAKPK